MHPVRIVAHTHWDREWYQTFEEFRARLVPVLDAALEMVSVDGAHFHLDGQTAMIDDYLDQRPERTNDVRDGIAAGGLSCGPFVTLLDGFLVSGESIVRNLEDGMKRTGQLGGGTTVAYQPDQFGHVSQIPQILSAAGFTHVVVWRGVPREVDGTGFTWASPDGSEVAAFYLPFGYGQGARLPQDDEGFARRLAEEVERTRPFLRDGETLLLTAGDDHEEPNVGLPSLIQSEREVGSDVAMTSLARHLSSWLTPELRIVGELRSAARANLLPSTYSVRPRQKAERARAEHLLERYAEPLAALVPGQTWPESDLRRAWMFLHLNGAHDSVCGCSTDGVARAVDERTASATRIATEVAGGALDRLVSVAPGRAPIAFNPSPFERAGVPGLGWGILDEPGGPDPLQTEIRDGWMVVGDHKSEVAIRVEDQDDGGDLYTFQPLGAVRPAAATVRLDGRGSFRFDTCDIDLEARRGEGDFVRFNAEIDNRAPDHRIRVLLRLPRPASSSRAGSPFDLVERPIRGESGESEPGSTLWPARGSVVAGGSGFLSEGVTEYELLGDELALTLMRCTGTISRAGPLPVRKIPAGPDVATPEAQLIGKNRISFGVFLHDPGTGVMKEWERYALPLMTTSGSGGGGPASSPLLELTTPALSSVRRIENEVRVTIFNPFETEQRYSLRGETATIGAHRIEML